MAHNDANPDPLDQGPYLTVDDVARLIRIPASSVRLYSNRGELPHFRIGRHLRFVQSDIEAWIRERSVRSLGRGPGTRKGHSRGAD